MENHQPVLALYDLRGIQKFIFHTNAVKEIIGGSEIVSTLLEKALREFVTTRKYEKKALLEWYHHDRHNQHDRPEDFRFCEDKTDRLYCEVLYCGGGNLLVVWKTEELARDAGRFMSKYVLEQAYSLSLSYATVKMSDSYQKDYAQLCSNLDAIKSMGYRAIPVSGCPFSVAEQGTDLPAVIRSGDERISKETHLKREAAESVYADHSNKRYCLKIDDITTGMDKNYVAVVHIDGNSMGMRIRDRLASCKDYPSAVYEMRKLSRRISYTFKNALDNTIDNQNKEKVSDKLVLRPIICAGDDITFICRADIAIDMVIDFINEIEGCAMCDTADGKPDLEHYAFSACAGIAYVRTHFPFYTAYEICEQLCSQAKKKAKSKTPVGSFLDFHIVSGAVLDDIESIREIEYVNAQGYSLLQRPLNCTKNAKGIDSVSTLLDNMGKFETLPRRWVKQARNAYCLGEGEILSVFKQANVYKERALAEDEKAFDSRRALYFDALELMDMIPGISKKKGGECDESKIDHPAAQ